MIFHYVWNEYNPVILGNIYRNQPGLLAGKIPTINGEGILGVVLGGLAALAFARAASAIDTPAGKAGQARSRRGDAVAGVYPSELQGRDGTLVGRGAEYDSPPILEEPMKRSPQLSLALPTPQTTPPGLGPKPRGLSRALLWLRPGSPGAVVERANCRSPPGPDDRAQ